MDQSDTPATIRRDGWTEARRVRFLEHLAHCGNVRAACAAVGVSHEAAYQLRRREPLFARAWAAALELARAASEQVLAGRAIDGIEQEVWYRGELVGTRVRYDSRLLLAHLARLDAAAADGAARENAERFDELLALVGGAEPSDAVVRDEDGVPLSRERAVALAIEAAQFYASADASDEDESGNSEVTAYLAGVEAAAARTAWRDEAHAFADRLLAEPLDRAAAKMPAWTLSGVSSSALAQAIAGGQPGASTGGDR